MPAFGSLPVEDVTTEEIERWIARFDGSPRSRNKLLIQLHGILGRAKKVYGLRTNAAAEVEKFAHRGSADIEVFSPEEVWALVRAAASELPEAGRLRRQPRAGLGPRDHVCEMGRQHAHDGLGRARRPHSPRGGYAAGATVGSMVWQIIDVSSNLLGEFADEPAALAAVREMIAREPQVTEEIGLLGWDDDGKPLVETALTGADLRNAAEDPEGIRGPRAA